MEISKGRDLDDVLSEIAPEAGAGSRIDMLTKEWLEGFERKVQIGDRAPRTLREYRRWASDDDTGYFRWWYGQSIWEIDAASVDVWSDWLAERGLSRKTRRNVMAGFHAFCRWVERKRRSFQTPRFEWPEAEEHVPATLSLDLQLMVLDAIPESQRGIFLALATCGIRPSEARVLRVRHWRGEKLQIREGAKDRLVDGEVRGPKKERAKRDVDVLPILCIWLEEHVPPDRRLRDPDAWLFQNPLAWNASCQWSETALRRAWAGACKRVGVRVGLYEGTKHTLGTLLKEQGVEDRVLARIFGHADVRSVQPYARIGDATLRNALAQLHKDTATRSSEGSRVSSVYPRDSSPKKAKPKRRVSGGGGGNRTRVRLVLGESRTRQSRLLAPASRSLRPPLFWLPLPEPAPPDSLAPPQRWPSNGSFRSNTSNAPITSNTPDVFLGRRPPKPAQAA